MSIYFIEPYNAYVKKRAKTPAEEIFEQNLQVETLARIMEAKNASLPENSPQVSTPTVGAPAAAAGAGGVPEVQFFHPTYDATYTATPTSGPAPLAVSFVNNSSKYVNVLWNFGDGTTGTGNVISHTFSTTGSFIVSCTASADGTVVTAAGSASISASVPVVTARFTASPTTGTYPLTVQFTNASTNASTYLWLFGTGSLSGSTTQQASSSAVNPSFQYWNSGSYTVTLQASGSYNFYTSTSSINLISASR